MMFVLRNKINNFLIGISGKSNLNEKDLEYLEEILLGRIKTQNT